MAVGFVAIMLWAPSVYAQVALPPQSRIVFLAALLAWIGLVAVGVVRRWRWMFWLIVVAFLAGALRTPASALELAGVLEHTGPTWYVVLQALVGAAQFAIGLALLKGYRKAGAWGAF